MIARLRHWLHSRTATHRALVDAAVLLQLTIDRNEGKPGAADALADFQRAHPRPRVEAS